jgi:hypothetical protein
MIENKSEELVGKFQIILENFKTFLKENSPFNDDQFTNILAAAIGVLSVRLIFHFKNNHF